MPLLIKLIAMAQNKLTSYFARSCSQQGDDFGKQLVTHSYLSHSSIFLGAESDEDDVQSESIKDSDCECPCCTMSDSVCQPLDVERSKITYSHNTHEPNKKKTYFRSLQTSWYQKYPWITVYHKLQNILSFLSTGKAQRAATLFKAPGKLFY